MTVDERVPSETAEFWKDFETAESVPPIIERKSAWVRCSERMPECPNGSSAVLLAYTLDGGECLLYFAGGNWRDSRYGTAVFEVTHWQPLPEPPA